MCWPDGAVTRCGPSAPAFRCSLHTSAAVRALLLRSDLRLGEAFLRGKSTSKAMKPGGRVFLDACSSRVKFPFSAFIKRHIWPGNATPLVPHEYLEAVAKSPFEVLKVVDDRESYRLTTLEWAKRLETARSNIVARWGERQFRRFQLYLWGCAHGFGDHEFGAYHMVLQKLDDQRARQARRAGWARLP